MTIMICEPSRNIELCRHNLEIVFTNHLEVLRTGAWKDRVIHGRIDHVVTQEGFLSAFRVKPSKEDARSASRYFFTAPYSVGFNGGASWGIGEGDLSAGDLVYVEQWRSHNCWRWIANVTTKSVYRVVR